MRLQCCRWTPACRGAVRSNFAWPWRNGLTAIDREFKRPPESDQTEVQAMALTLAAMPGRSWPCQVEPPSWVPKTWPLRVQK